MSALPLEGRRVLVGRALHQASKLSDRLRALGAEPVEVPVLEIRPPANFAPLDEAMHRLETYNWLILTSANAVRAVVERAAVLGVRLNGASQLRVAAVGSATADVARQHGLPVAVVPKTYVAENLAECLADLPRGQRILLARAEVARDVIPDALRAGGAQVDMVDAYRNVMPEAAPGLLREAMAKKIDAATFTSSSSVTHLAEAAGQVDIAFPFAGVRAISIGPITSQTLRELGWEPAAEATVSDIEGLVGAVLVCFG